MGASTGGRMQPPINSSPSRGTVPRSLRSPRGCLGLILAADLVDLFRVGLAEGKRPETREHNLSADDFGRVKRVGAHLRCAGTRDGAELVMLSR